MADRFQNGSLQLAIEFVGGPRDGERLLGSFADGVLTEAANIYRHTEGAGIGKRFWCPCEYTINAVRTMEWEELERLDTRAIAFVARCTKSSSGATSGERSSSVPGMSARPNRARLRRSA